MKKLLSLVLVLALLPVSAFADSEWLTVLDEKNIKLNDRTTLYSGDYVNGNSSGLLSENYLIYQPGEGVAPLVCFGKDVAGAAGFSRIVEIEAEAGNTVVSGVNGDYFTMATGVAMGLIIKNGRICSSERLGYESVGFKADGSAIIGSPQLNVSLTINPEGLSFSNLNFNKTLTDTSGLMVYSDDFGPDNDGGRHYSAVVRISEGNCVPGGEVKGVIESVGLRDTDQPLEEGTLVLSASENCKYVTVTQAFAALNVGDEVSVSFGMSEDWLDVVNAVGAERRLVSGGEISSNILEDANDKTRAPRTAIGIREDGSVVVYTADGRDSSHSSGFLFRELAQRMVDLGCIEAVNLDGGASTQMYAEYPGSGKVSQVNQSSGNGIRRCADYLVFINTLEQTGELARLHIYPYSTRVLEGAAIPITLTGSDDAWYPVDVSHVTPVWSVSGAEGEVRDSSFVAGKKAGTAMITASFGKVSGSAEIEIITKPDEINVTYADGKALPSRLYIYAGESVSMKASAIYNKATLYSDENSYEWHTEPELGTVENGVFTAAEDLTTPVEGFVTVVAGETAKSIPVTVYKDLVPPVISGEVSGNLLMATVTDVYDPQFGKKNVSVRLDGAKTSFEMTEAGGVYVNLPAADGKLHHIVIEATDCKGNKSRMGFEIVLAAVSDGTEAPVNAELFADLPHGDAYFPYAEYLKRRGVMAGKLNSGVLYFDKDATLTRQEFAAVLCNWLKVDTAQYENDQLSFSDTGEISSWANPFVKAVCSKGYMAGKARNDGSIDFDPLGTITRQEVLTVLSKLLGEGYFPAELNCSDAGSVAAWALPFVQLAVNNGISKPGTGALRPLDAITRGELGYMMISMD